MCAYRDNALLCDTGRIDTIAVVILNKTYVIPTKWLELGPRIELSPQIPIYNNSPFPAFTVMEKQVFVLWKSENTVLDLVDF